MNSSELSELRDFIAKHLKLSDIKNLCMDLDLDYEEIAGETKSDKARELVDLMNKRGKLENLRDALKKFTPVRTIELHITPTFIPHPYPEAPNFTGRVAERKMLTEWLTQDQEHPLLSMVAIGGMGKSALAWRWLQEEVIEKGLELDGVVWWSFYEREANFTAFINESIDYLFSKEKEELRKRADREKMDLVLREFQNRRFLVVFDGFERTLRAYAGLSACYIGDEYKREEGEKYRECLDLNLSWFLRSLGNFQCKTKTLLTTRLHPLELRGLAGVRQEDLKRMEPDDAVIFFQCQSVKGSAPEIRMACEKYDYLPLCLRLLSGVLITSPKYKGDIKFAQEIPDLRLTDVDEYHQDAKKFEHILQFSFDNLRESNKMLISQLSAFRSPMNFAILKSIIFAKMSDDDFRKRMDCLEKRGMLLYNSDKDIYDFHPVVRRYCYGKLTTPKKTHGKIAKYFKKLADKGVKYPDKDTTKMIEYYAEHPDELPEDLREEFEDTALSLLEPEYPKVESLEDLQLVIELYHHTVGAGRYDEAYNLFNERIDNATYYQFGAYNLQIELLRALFPDGEHKPPILSKESDQAQLINDLASVYSLSGQLRRAIQLQKQSKMMTRKHEDKRNEETDIGNLAFDHINIGDLEYAELNLRLQIKICSEIEEVFGEGSGQQELGKTLSYLGRFKESDKKLRKSMKLSEKEEHIQGQTVTWSYRSLCALLMDNPKEALKCCEEALKFAIKDEETDARTPRDFVSVNWLFGYAYNELAKISEGEEKEVHLRQAEIYLNSGYDYQITIDGKKIKRHCDGAIVECRQINLVDHEAAILLQLAKLRFLQDKKEVSLNLATEALSIANRCSYVLQQADIHLFLAEYYKDLGDIEKARKECETAIERCKQRVDVETGELIYKDNKKYWYKPCYDKAIALIESMT